MDSKTEQSFKCARCPNQIKPEDERVKIGRFTYCDNCAEEKKLEKK